MSFSPIPENETTAVRYGRRILNDQTEMPLELMVNSVMFTFSRISSLNTVPLTTRAFTSPANSDINEKHVVCQDRITCILSSTTVNVISRDVVQGRFLFHSYYEDGTHHCISVSQ